MAKKYFGTDGIRDVANSGNLTPGAILRMAQCVAKVLRDEREGGGVSERKRPKIGVGADTRVSGEMIKAALTAGLTSLGLDVVDFGVVPTPALAYLTRTRGFGMGIMISASHNFMADNGIKIFSPEGLKLSDDTEERIEALIDDGDWEPDLPTGSGVGRVVSDASGLDDYISYLVDSFEPGMLNGLTVAVDCANGAAWKAAPETLARLGAKVSVMANAPNGSNINEKCGSVHPEALAGLVVDEGCRAGVALDGDADRSLFVDSRGVLVDGDAVMAALAPRMKEKGELAHDTVVVTVMSNMGLEAALHGHGIRLERTPVGDRYVTELLQKGGYSLGGEQSGHIIFGASNGYAGDGTYTALRVFQAMAETGLSMEELVSDMETFPQVLINVEVSSKPPLEELEMTAESVRNAESALGGDGRVLLRYSGTEKKIRVMIEGKDSGLVEKLARTIAQTVKKEIG